MKYFGIKYKLVSSSSIKYEVRKSVYELAVNLIKQELTNYKYESKLSYGDNYCNDFFNESENKVVIASIDLWDCFPNARHKFDHNGANDVYGPLYDAAKAVSAKLPNGYEVKADGDWDDLIIFIEAN